jgi:hypothetical protein
MGVEASQHGSVPDDTQSTEGQKAASPKQKDWSAFEIPVNREKSSRLSGLKAMTTAEKTSAECTYGPIPPYKEPYSSKLQPAQPGAARGVKETGAIQVRDERQKGISVKASVTHDVCHSSTLLCLNTRLLAVTCFFPFLLSIFDSRRDMKTCSCSCGSMISRSQSLCFLFAQEHEASDNGLRE